MTESELIAIEERVNKATPGPWRLADPNEFPNPDYGPSRSIVAQNGFGVVSCSFAEFPRTPDAEFCTKARQDVPKLIQAIRERDERIQELETVKSFRGSIENLDDTILFKVIADKSMAKGFAYLIVNYEDYSKMQCLGWNMEKPDCEYKENRIAFKAISNEDQQ